MRFDRRVQLAAAAALFLFSLLWYHWLFTSHLTLPLPLVPRGLLGLIPIAVAALLSHRVFADSFLGHLCVAVGLILAQTDAFYPHTPDMAFHIGKVLWASRGRPLIDPAMGIRTPYPWIFHAIWGWIAHLTHAAPVHLLRWASVWNVVGIVGVAWLFARRFTDKQVGQWLPWLCSLPLVTKDASSYLMATPSFFSFPLALAGWWVFASAQTVRGVVGGVVLLIGAAFTWPGHLFPMAGVALVYVAIRPRDARTLVVSLGAVAAAGGAWLVHWLASGGAASSGTHLYPSFSLADFGRVVIHVLSLGADSNGWLVAAAAISLTVILITLIALGRRPAQLRPSTAALGKVGIGMVLGMLLSIWFMVQPAFWSRMASLAGFVMLPIAALGVAGLLERCGCYRSAAARVGHLLLGGVWLVPFLAAGIVNAERTTHWQKRDAPAVAALERLAHPSARVYASPQTMNDLVMGQLPLFGFLGHAWPEYFGAPAQVADSIGRAYNALTQLNAPVDEAQRQLERDGVAFVILSRGELKTLPLGRVLQERLVPAWSDTAYTVFPVQTVHAPPSAGK